MNTLSLNIQVNMPTTPIPMPDADRLTSKFIRVLQALPAEQSDDDITLREAHIHRGEQRYLVNDALPLLRRLAAHGAPQEFVPGRPETEVTTIYMDTPEGTWSVGNSSVKFRCRSYQNPQLWWFEMKRRANTTVDKWRQPLATAALPELVTGETRWHALKSVIGARRLLPIVAVRYWRIAFEWPGLRVTVDREVAFHAVSPSAPHRLGEKIGGVNDFVVEVKPSAEVPAWLASELLHYPINQLSKSKRALEARSSASGN